MDVAAGAALAALGGAAVGAAVGWVLGRRSRAATPRTDDTMPSPDVPEGLGRLLAVLPGAAFVVGSDNTVLRASARAVTIGVGEGGRLEIPEVLALVGAVRRDGVIREEDLELRRPPLGKGVLQARVRVAPLSRLTVLVLVEDLSESFRVDAVRRDFVANVSHELKTPVGALSLLAEAVQSASDDPDAVQRFSARMQVESQRLSNLISDLVDLSRLQSGDPLKHSERVEVDRVVAEAVDATKLLATAREIDVVVGEPSRAEVLGQETQLVMALRNLLTNAVAYSPAHTRVAVAARADDRLVEISVTDQGIGIPEGEQSRIFERFYRVDPARSRVTGGTGLGLAIVKHVCANHGGECTVWSVPGEGSTFTLRLPLAPQTRRTPEGDPVP
ncbi:MAG: two-component sensor histidine kinase [Frankiales bacterium]|nr:two-component sensor histidine kinase [Frankiales bacterium]